MNKTLQADLYRYKGLTSVRKGFKLEGFKYTYFLRKAASHGLYSPLGLYYRFRLRKLRYKYGIQIPIATKIGGGLFIGHFGLIVVNENAIIGRNCNLSHGVTIGKTNRGERKGSPIIGDMVWIGTGSVIVGKINIGSNVLIAPNSFVNVDVPDYSIVIGNPVKIISNKNPVDGYINFTSEQE